MLISLVTTVLQHRRKAVKWFLLKWIIPGTMLGSFLGFWIAKQLTTETLQLIFAFFCVLLGIKLIIKPSTFFKKVETISGPILFILSIIVGIAAGLLGLGGGILLMPLLLFYGLSMVQVSATTAACIFPTAASGALAAMWLGSHLTNLPPYTTGFIYWPAVFLLGIGSLLSVPLGVRFSHQIPENHLKRGFGLILFIVAWRMLPFQW